MPANRVISEYADSLIEQRVQCLSPVLRQYDEFLSIRFSEEREDLVARASQLDHAFQAIIVRCAEALGPKDLVIEMRRLRIRGLRFFLFLSASRRLLKSVGRRLRAQVRVEGYAAEVTMLKIEQDMAEIDSQLFETDEIFRNLNGQYERKPKLFSQANELNLFLRACLLPIKSIKNRRPFEQSARNYAKAMAGLIAASTKEIYKQQLHSLATVFWRVIQPTILPFLVSIATVWLIHAGLELAGFEVFHLKLSVLLVLISTYLSEKAIEHFFGHWHLRRYRKQCVHTALTLYFAEMRARAALIGLLMLSEGVPKGDRASED
jgi:hypothetical protein